MVLFMVLEAIFFGIRYKTIRELFFVITQFGTLLQKNVHVGGRQISYA